LALNDNVIGRPFYSGQLDFQKRDSVGLETAQPLIEDRGPSIKQEKGTDPSFTGEIR